MNMCLWSGYGDNPEHIGDVQIRDLFSRNGKPFIQIPMCETCWNNHNKLMTIMEENNCDYEKASEIFEKSFNKEKSR